MAQTVKNPWVRKIPWRKAWKLIPVFLPGEFHGQRILPGYKSVGSQRVRHDQGTNTHTHTHTHTHNWTTKEKNAFAEGRKDQKCLIVL